MRRTQSTAALILLATATVAANAASVPSPAKMSAEAAAPVFRPAERAVSTWRAQAADSLDLGATQADALRGDGTTPPVARCIKLNNYWCIKKAGWNGEIAADEEGHVAFSSAAEGAAVAALLLKRYYLDFGRKTAVAIVSRWAPAQCGSLLVASRRPPRSGRSLAPKALAGTLRARWLASHSRGFVLPVRGSVAQIRRSIVPDRVSRPEAAPTIAVGLGESRRPMAPMTLDALLAASPNVPASRSMLGGAEVGVLRGRTTTAGSGTTCSDDTARIAAYAATAGAGIATGPDGDLGLFLPDGTPTANLATMMANMARVEIGGRGARAALIATGISQAFRPGRNPPSH